MYFEKIRQIISEQFEVNPAAITEDTTLDDIDADSLDLYDLVQTLEVEFDIEFREEDLEKIKSVHDIISFIDDTQERKTIFL